MKRGRFRPFSSLLPCAGAPVLLQDEERGGCGAHDVALRAGRGHDIQQKVDLWPRNAYEKRRKPWKKRRKTTRNGRFRGAAGALKTARDCWNMLRASPFKPQPSSRSGSCCSTLPNSESCSSSWPTTPSLGVEKPRFGPFPSISNTCRGEKGPKSSGSRAVSSSSSSLRPLPQRPTSPRAEASSGCSRGSAGDPPTRRPRARKTWRNRPKRGEVMRNLDVSGPFRAD